QCVEPVGKKSVNGADWWPQRHTVSSSFHSVFERKTNRQILLEVSTRFTVSLDRDDRDPNAARRPLIDRRVASTLTRQGPRARVRPRLSAHTPLSSQPTPTLRLPLPTSPVL